MKVRVFLTSIILIFSGVIYYFVSRIFLPITGGALESRIEVKIKSGLSVRAIADTLEKRGIITDADDFIFTTKLFKNSARLKAGQYDFSTTLSSYHAMKILVAGNYSSTRVVIPEGMTSYEIASLLRKKTDIDSSRFIDLVFDRRFIASLGIKSNSLEGYLFPNTYDFEWGINEEAIIKILVKEFQRNFSDSLSNHVFEKGWTVHQILTLASIIEGEAMVDSERAMVSAVYYNRLKQGILLQADPTIQYIIPDGPRRLLRKDLAIDSPYNTYLHPGLPPGPVNNPGLKSILAAINPAHVAYLYLVAKGDGSHIFSRTLREHQIAKQRFDEFRRMINRKKKANDQNG